MSHRAVPLKLVPPGLLVDRHEIGIDGIVVHSSTRVARCPRAPVLRVGWYLPRCTAAMDEPSAIFRRMVGSSGSVWQRGVSDARTQRASVRSLRSGFPRISSRLTLDAPLAWTCLPMRSASPSAAVPEKGSLDASPCRWAPTRCCASCVGTRHRRRPMFVLSALTTSPGSSASVTEQSSAILSVAASSTSCRTGRAAPSRTGSRTIPDIEIVCRDRGSGYREGATKGAPQAIQISDHGICWRTPLPPSSRA